MYKVCDGNTKAIHRKNTNVQNCEQAWGVIRVPTCIFRKCGRFREREPKQRTYSEPWTPVARTRDSMLTSEEDA